MATTKNDKFSFNMTSDQLTNLLRKIKDLVAIDPRIIMKIDNSSILIFSFVGESFKNIHAFKNYIFNKEEIMNISTNIQEPFVFITKDGKKMYRILENLIDYKDNIKGEIIINDQNYVNLITFNNENLNINDKKLSIGETKWKLNICDIEYEDVTLAFPKKYFNTINPSDIKIYVFESFILCKYSEYNLMILMETTI